MAEIGLIASIIGVASAGAKLSLALYQFADIVGSAAAEVRDIASEISLFCSILRQLDSTLHGAKSTRYSLTALATAESIIAECRRVFNQIQALVDRLKRESVEAPEDLTLAWTARVKWVFQRSKVALYRSKLESMKTTLLLMLTTLNIAERASELAHETLEDENDQALAQSLVITQQLALDKLRVEEENEVKNNDLKDQNDNRKSWDVIPEINVELFEYLQEAQTSTVNPPAGSQAKKRQNRVSQVMNGIVTDSRLSSPIQEPNTLAGQLEGSMAQFRQDLSRFKLGLDNESPSESKGRERVDSIWLSNTVFTDGLTPAARRESWTRDTTVALAKHQVKSLLSRWIDHVDPTSSQPQNSPPQVRPQTRTDRNHTRSPPGSKLISPKEQDRTGQRSSSGQNTSSQTPEPATPAAYFFRNSTLDLSLTDKTPRVLSKYLRMFNHSADPVGFSLSIEFDDEEMGGRREEILPPQGCPLVIFGIKSKQGTMPQFLLKKKDALGGDSKSWMKRIVSLDSLL